MENNSLISSEIVKTVCDAAMRPAKEAVSYDTEQNVKTDEVHMDTFYILP